MTLYDLIAIVIALGTSLTLMALALKQNAQLQRENLWLRKTNRELRKRMESMVKVPF